MAKADWENEDFDPKPFQKSILIADRWEGEDEEEDIKDNWDDEEEEGDDDKPKENATAVQPKKKRSLAQVLAEKEEKRRKELEEKMKNQTLKDDSDEDEEDDELTAEEIYSEKMRQQKLQEESDLELAKDAFGVMDSATGLDSMNPKTKEDFDVFRKELVTKITTFDSSLHYSLFLEELFRDICITLQQDDIKKITSSLNALATEKLKAAKATKGKKKSKKATLNTGRNEYAIGDYNDYGNEYEDCI